MQSLLILGRQPELGLAEIESLYGANKISLISPEAALVDVDPKLLALKRLGGSLKLAKLITALDSKDWQDVERELVKTLPEKASNMPEGKITLGLSAYGFNVDVRTISRTGLGIKRAIQKTNRSVRLVPNKTTELNTAQVFHNKLTKKQSMELLIVRGKDQTYIAQTVMVQDIESYAKRDQARPFRDSRVGMLPPKLAQIIINLSVGLLDNDNLKSVNNDGGKTEIVKLNKTILDPFMGTGVILQEAYLMGYDVIGSDISSRMVEYSRDNLKWIVQRYGSTLNLDGLSVGDAVKTKWSKFDYIASETNLGKPLSSVPPNSELEHITRDVDKLITDFLVNVAGQTKTGTRLCLAVPAWQISKGRFKKLPVIDHLTDIGYTFIDFKQVRSRELIYYRPEQIVARQLLALVRN